MHEVVKMAFNYNFSCINKKATGEKKKKKDIRRVTFLLLSLEKKFIR